MINNNNIFGLLGQILGPVAGPNENPYFKNANDDYSIWAVKQDLIAQGIDPDSVFPPKKNGKSQEEIDKEKADKEAKQKEQQEAAEKKKKEQEEQQKAKQAEAEKKKAEQEANKKPDTLNFNDAIDMIAKVASIENARKDIMEKLVLGREKELDSMVDNPGKAKTLSDIDQIVMRRRERDGDYVHRKIQRRFREKDGVINLRALIGGYNDDDSDDEMVMVHHKKPQPRVKVVHVYDRQDHDPTIYVGSHYVQVGTRIIPTAGVKCYGI
jgi:hypothetical protein